jgi:nucleotide-binding universal stress UspA family protein
MNLNTIVVPLDASETSERALPIAEALAERVNAGLLVVSAQAYGPLEPTAYVIEMAERVTRCPVDTLATKDDDAITIIAEALGHHDDRVVCMTTHGRGSVQWAALGSVAEEVIRRTEQPILLIGNECRPDFLERGKFLLACADRPEAAGALAAPTSDWAEALDLRRQVAVVVHPLDVESAEHSAPVLDPIARALGVPTADAMLLRRNSVAGALVQCADVLPAALIATNSHARTGLARFALGSETMDVVRHAHCPVLVTHPRAETAK